MGRCVPQTTAEDDRPPCTTAPRRFFPETTHFGQSVGQNGPLIYRKVAQWKSDAQVALSEFAVLLQ